MQHSYAKHQKTTSNLLGITFKGRLRVSNDMTTKGSYANKTYMCGKILGGGGAKFLFFVVANISKYWWFQPKNFTGLLGFIKLYKQKPFDFFSFTIHQNHTLALIDILQNISNILSFQLFLWNDVQRKFQFICFFFWNKHCWDETSLKINYQS